SFLVAVYFQFIHQSLGFQPLHGSLNLLIGVGITTAGWLLVTFLTPPADRETLVAFYEQIRPMGPGWKAVVGDREPLEGESMAASFLCWLLGVAAVYGFVFGTGYLLYGFFIWGLLLVAIAVGCAAYILKLLPRVGLR